MGYFTHYHQSCSLFSLFKHSLFLLSFGQGLLILIFSQQRFCLLWTCFSSILCAFGFNILIFMHITNWKYWLINYILKVRQIGIPKNMPIKRSRFSSWIKQSNRTYEGSTLHYFQKLRKYITLFSDLIYF